MLSCNMVGIVISFSNPRILAIFCTIYGSLDTANEANCLIRRSYPRSLQLMCLTLHKLAILLLTCATQRFNNLFSSILIFSSTVDTTVFWQRVLFYIPKATIYNSHTNNNEDQCSCHYEQTTSTYTATCN